MERENVLEMLAGRWGKAPNPTKSVHAAHGCPGPIASTDPQKSGSRVYPPPAV